MTTLPHHFGIRLMSNANEIEVELVKKTKQRLWLRGGTN